MTNLQAALGVAQMEELPEFIKRKHSNYELYQNYSMDLNSENYLAFEKEHTQISGFIRLRFQWKE